MVAKTNIRLREDDLVLVTGANGFIGSHIADVLLEEGFRVRGTVRNSKPWLNDLFEKRHGAGRFEAFELHSFDDKTACSDALEGVSGVIHVVRSKLPTTGI